MTTTQPLTHDSIRQFEDQRQRLWDEESAWWLVRKEILARQIDLRSKFRDAHDLQDNVAIEQQIADWRWNKAHPKDIK